MKKLLLLIVPLIIMSCSKDKKTYTNESIYPRFFKFKDNSGVGPNWYDWRIYLGEDDHEYLTNHGTKSLVLIHYPDCKKCLVRDSLKKY